MCSTLERKSGLKVVRENVRYLPHVQKVAKTLPGPRRPEGSYDVADHMSVDVSSDIEALVQRTRSLCSSEARTVLSPGGCLHSDE